MNTIMTNERQILRAVSNAIAELKKMQYLEIKIENQEYADCIMAMVVLNEIQQEAIGEFKDEGEGKCKNKE